MRWQASFSVVILLSGVCAVGQLPRPFSTQPVSLDPGQASSLRSETVLLLSGRVQLEDGSPVPGSVTLQMDCNGQMHTEAYADLNGAFNFQLDPSGGTDQGVLPMPSDSMAPIPEREWQACDLVAQSPGYRSSKLPLSKLVGQSGLVTLGTVVMHPVASAGSGFMISAADASVPKNARKDFEKGQSEAKKGKWAAAREKFEKALALYPRFATAWLALGAIQTQESNFAAARKSYNQALQVDSRLLNAYVGLAQIAATQAHWQELADTTSHLLEINPVGLPQFWFLNAVANFNLHKFDVAEKSVLRSMSLDSEHHVAKNEYLLGRILAVRHDYAAAAQHLKAYLETAPKDAAATEARTQLAQYERLAGLGRPGQQASEAATGK